MTITLINEIKITKSPEGQPTVTYTLTPEQLEAAYREQERNYRLMDAVNQLADYYSVGEFYQNDGDYEANWDRFQTIWGFSYGQAINPNSVYYLLDSLADRFLHCQSCDNAENDIWESVITELEREHTASKGRL